MKTSERKQRLQFSRYRAIIVLDKSTSTEREDLLAPVHVISMADVLLLKPEQHCPNTSRGLDAVRSP
jgi:hypothetical protein